MFLFCEEPDSKCVQLSGRGRGVGGRGVVRTVFATAARICRTQETLDGME